jgi:uncharacterized membrane protein
MNKKYQTQVLDIQQSKMNPKISTAILAYLLMIIGLNLFVLPNIRKGHELNDSLLYGFIFGIVVYGIYDFTAYSLFDKWDIKLAIQDILWGGFLFFIASYIGSILS